MVQIVGVAFYVVLLIQRDFLHFETSFQAKDTLQVLMAYLNCLTCHIQKQSNKDTLFYIPIIKGRNLIQSLIIVYIIYLE